MKNENGFSLLLILVLLLGAGAAIVAGKATFENSLESQKNNITVNRLNRLQQVISQYYQAHHELPAAGSAGTMNNLVPVDALGLTMKYRLDGWGQFFYYQVNDQTAINDVEIESIDVAGVIISAGPDQILDSIDSEPAVFPPPPPAVGWEDDLHRPLNVMTEALVVARQELAVLTKKQCACYKAQVAWCDWTTAPPPPTAADDFLARYGLGESFLDDPWSHPYEWNHVIGNFYFYSIGPDGLADTDDDIKGAVLTAGKCS